MEGKAQSYLCVYAVVDAGIPYCWFGVKPWPPLGL